MFFFYLNTCTSGGQGACSGGGVPTIDRRQCDDFKTHSIQCKTPKILQNFGLQTKPQGGGVNWQPSLCPPLMYKSHLQTKFKMGIVRIFMRFCPLFLLIRFLSYCFRCCNQAIYCVDCKKLPHNIQKLSVNHLHSFLLLAIFDESNLPQQLSLYITFNSMFSIVKILVSNYITPKSSASVSNHKKALLQSLESSLNPSRSQRICELLCSLLSNGQNKA